MVVILLGVTFVPASPKPPIQCVLTMNKQDEVRKIKTDLQELLHIETIWPLIVADGLDHHICKLLVCKPFIKLESSFDILFNFSLRQINSFK